MNKQAGFTITEILIVVTLLVIFASFAFVSLVESAASARDAQRQADLLNLQAAVELYKKEKGRYPAGCRVTDWDGNWSGQAGSGYDCGGGRNDYIEGLAPEFIPVLPTDPKLNPDVANSGYVYTTNPDGTAYKIMALNTVESETVTYAHEFVRCGDMGLGPNENACVNVPSSDSGAYGGPDSQAGGTPDACTTAGDYNNDYAVSGGFAVRGGSPLRYTPRAREFHTDKIRCK